MADEVHLEIIEQGVEKWNRWREVDSKSQPDLSGAYLFEAELSGINLSGANLSRACLIGAKLKEANLRGANLQTLYASAVNLEGADLANANLKQANLSEARLAHTNFSQASAEGVNFSKSDLTGACIENWQVNAKTDFADITCNYLYRKHSREERYPQEGDFTPETFLEFIRGYLSNSEPSNPDPSNLDPSNSEPSNSEPSSQGLSEKPEYPILLGDTSDLANQELITSPEPGRPISRSQPKVTTSPRSGSSSQTQFSLQQWRLIAAGSLVVLIVASTVFAGILSRLIASRRSEADPPEYLLGPNVNLASLPCNELPPPDLQTQEPSFTYSNGVKFYGQFEDGIPVNGRGIMVFNDGNRYDGEFLNGERSGCGTFTFASGRQYMGQFESDQFHGVGIWELETGERYIGQFEYNKCEGWGTFLFTDGSSKSGTWEGGTLAGDTLSCNRGIASEPEETIP
ncbi:MAG: pentapeptide repeat-containing protein [Cyanobacteria bacterium J06639_14]